MNPTATNAKGENSHSYPAYDYPVSIGTGLVAPKAGVITGLPGVPTRELMSPLQNGQAWPTAGGGSPNSGNVMVIDHGGGEYTAYLHVSPYDVSAFRGRRVSQGEVFHKSGHNGWSTGPHLHFEVWKNGARVDPGPWLANIKQGEDMSKDSLTHDEVAKISVGMANLQPEAREAFMNNIGLPLNQVLDNFLNYSESRNLRLDAQAYRNGQSKSPDVNRQSVLDYVNKNLK